MATPGTFNPSEILITGGRGYVGSHLLSLTEALVLDLAEGSPLQEFDPRDSRYRDVKVIVHLADRRLEELDADNLAANVRTHAEFIRRAGDLPRLTKFIFSSSCSVYGFSEELISEGSPVRPTSFYAESKLAVERRLQDSGLPWLILRFGTAHGLSPRMRSDLLVNQFARAAARAQTLDIYEPTAWRPYIHCRDFARFLHSRIPSSESGLRNVVTENLSKKEILEMDSFRESGLCCRFVDRGDARNYRVAIEPDLLPEPRRVKEGIAEMMEYYRENPS